VFGDQILEKPRTKEEARERIVGYGKAPCRTVGSIVLTDTISGRRVSGVDTAVIHFSPIPDDIIQELLDEGEVMHCAGGLMVEHPLVLPYRRLEGAEDSVMGLSLSLLDSLLEKLDSSGN
jgi:septum formation protein